ncbi:MAG: SHOCT domain-containing protein [Candidatus Dormibacteraceae bacterium]
MWGYFDGGSWLWMAAFVIRALSGTKSDDQAVDLLRRRLAGGEITQEEFEKTSKSLQG